MIGGRWRPPRAEAEAVSLWRRFGERIYRLGLTLREHMGHHPEVIPGAAVLSVGNLEAGGTGKTPCVLWWARQLADLGRTTVVCRPYGPPAAGEASDEIAELRESLPPGVGLEYDRRKLDAARRAAAAGAEYVVVDDAFSHRRLARDLDLVLLDARHPFGNGRLLPAGPLREPPGAVVRADAVVLSRADRAAAGDLERSRSRIRSVGFDGPILTARHRITGLVEAGELRPPAGERVVCASGLGHPGELEEAAIAAGLEVVGGRSFGDHHRLTARQWREISVAAAARSARLLMTRKDSVRLPAEARREILVLEIEWDWLSGDVDPTWLLERLASARRQ